MEILENSNIEGVNNLIVDLLGKANKQFGYMGGIYSPSICNEPKFISTLEEKLKENVKVEIAMSRLQLLNKKGNNLLLNLIEESHVKQHIFRNLDVYILQENLPQHLTLNFSFCYADATYGLCENPHDGFNGNRSGIILDVERYNGKEEISDDEKLAALKYIFHTEILRDDHVEYLSSPEFCDMADEKEYDNWLTKFNKTGKKAHFADAKEFISYSCGKFKEWCGKSDFTHVKSFSNKAMEDKKDKFYEEFSNIPGYLEYADKFVAVAINPKVRILDSDINKRALWDKLLPKFQYNSFFVVKAPKTSSLKK